MGVAEIKARKRIAPQEQLLDRAGRVELAANEFRITQTEQKINRESIHGESHATSAHYDVGTEVRATTAKIGGTMPENLPAETSIRKLKSRRKGRSNEMLP